MLEKMSLSVAERLLIVLVTKEIFEEDIVSNAGGFTTGIVFNPLLMALRSSQLF